jgi:hypothetical protein
MLETKDPQDPLIRFILISAASVAVTGFLFSAATAAVLVSMNFNILNWME